MISKYSALQTPIGDQAYSLARNNAALKILLNSKAKSGPFDGGCLVFAEALKHKIGGDLVRIVSEGITQHYGLQKGLTIYDGEGAHPNPKTWLEDFVQRERISSPSLTIEHGLDLFSEIPRDPKASLNISRLL